ncbi:PTPLA-domain-containing protein [Dendrothele bispora CBS 962.96]|uniref:Very-long-chain (3R)-3-hydroxyacyl-CoA dehydratase n=1 Tax=Dendrothele bispora (strain CBS 962.96) TaxID=1314807 RepID=A0A4S8M026_DENBC|nr:PTPLA-domain-containing protein [Dendrothele bispora CBS 962.96]
MTKSKEVKKDVVAPPVPPKATTKKSTPTAVKYYLFAYNALSTLGWAYVLILTLVHVFNVDGKSSTIAATTAPTARNILSRVFSSVPFLKSTASVSSLESRLPSFLVPFLRRSTTTFNRVGAVTAFVQSCALLEVAHVLLGWVRSPLQTTVMQVSSRLFLVWGIVEQFEATRSNPLYTSMVFAWSFTEVIRYSFYASNLLGYEPPVLLHLRYTTFYVLYPLGAGSEAFLIYSTLPSSSPVPSWSSWIQGMWKPTDYIRAGLFAIWWPGLYIMYTHMIKQRRKVMGGKLKVN